MDNTRLQVLIEKYLNSSLTPSEANEILQMLDREEFARVIEERIDSELEHQVYDEPDELTQVHQRLQTRLNERIKVGKVRRLNVLRWMAAAIVLLMVGGATLFLYRNNRGHQPAVAIAQAKTAVGPGKNGAVLTLSNGKTIVLDDSAKGQLAVDAGVKVIRENGELKYVGENGEVVYNDIKTSRGQTWIVNLPDGSKVWLNAASSIHYPISFSGKERIVEMTGECYFEVKHDAAHLFRVKVNGRFIDDIGTSFNVNGYQDEPVMKTTLVEGSIRMGNAILKPGEQMRGDKIVDADVEHETAWKNGTFSFVHTDLSEMMRQLSRWYDVDVEYVGSVPGGITFSGKIGRSLTLEQVLKGLRIMNLHYSIEDNKKIVITQQ